jgi:Protein of unknown function (DUF2911)
MKKILPITALAIFMACNTNNKQKDKSNSSHNNHTMSDIAVSGYADSVNAGLIEKDTMKSSPARTAMATVGKTHLHISYHSPGVKGRIIWGGLVPYNTVWVTGAHSATSIQINRPISINNKTVEAGTYAIFTIPGEKEWIFILNKNHEQHLTDNYSATDDIVRLAVKPEQNELTQRLTYTVAKTGDKSGNISMQWEKVKIVIPFITQ